MSDEIQGEVSEVKRAANELWTTAEFLKSPFFTAQLMERVALAVVEAHSPWLTATAAEYYAGVSLTSINQAADQGVIRRYHVGGRIVFKKAEIDAAIESGTWPKQKRKAA